MEDKDVVAGLIDAALLHGQEVALEAGEAGDSVVDVFGDDRGHAADGVADKALL